MVADNLQLVLLPPEQRFLDENLANRREGKAALDRLDQLRARACNATAFATQGEGGANDHRQADPTERGKSLVDRLYGPAARGLEADALHRLAETLPRLRLLNRIGLGADHFDAVALQHA